ncbi:MAG: biopolymer transporter ExbD [Opitutae bacterium]|nr:biopolymer transporter ExbD [Opitutae bacterium]|tara:strand:+ start:3115 stop:3516 length:402 start_codon:yes stop_codon:yes gene_type:complete
MKLRRRLLKEKETESINVSPLIDVVFILLIFFIVSASFVKVPGEKVVRPRTVTSESLQKNAILFALTAGNSLHYAGEKIAIDQVRSLVEGLRREVDAPVIIQVDQDADASRLAEVAREGKKAGATVSIATRKP